MNNAGSGIEQGQTIYIEQLYTEIFENCQQTLLKTEIIYFHARKLTIRYYIIEIQNTDLCATELFQT